MRLDKPRDVGLFVRDQRRERGLTQADLSERARVSRRWLADLEAGKATVELGLVLRVLQALDLELIAQPAAKPAIDLDEVLRNYAARGTANP